MKKVLFTLLALGASCTALAQSSVTIYGVADAGLVVDKDAAGDRLTRVASGVASGSRIGFKGKEDLGNGLSALFVLESGFNIDTGTSGQGGLLFGRQAYVGLSGKGGTVTLGRQYSPYYLALRDVADPFVIGLAGTASNVMATNYRVDNMAQYATPTWNKLSAELAYGFGEVADDNAKNRSLGGAPSRDSAVQQVRVRMVAPCSAASTAFSTTRRASSTQPSEYTKPRLNWGFNGVPAAWRARSMPLEAGRISRFASMSYRNRPARISQAGRWPWACGMTKRSGHMMCGAERSSTSRSISALRTRPNS